MFLVTDTGGTNTRIALADKTGLHNESLRRFRNADFTSFDALLDHYLQDHETHSLSACAFAFAGPVHGPAPRLTNLDWVLDTDRLEATLGAPVHLFNDLAALGHAVTVLPATAFHPICDRGGEDNGQRLVVGVGTGMNVSAVKSLSEQPPAIWACEYGHAPLPAPLNDALQAAGLPAGAFPSTEHLFSGGGLARCRAANIPDTTYATWLGQLCTSLCLQYQPLGGLALAGGVARALLTPEAGRSAFLAGLDRTAPHPAISLITSDEAALQGCLAVLTH